MKKFLEPIILTVALVLLALTAGGLAFYFASMSLSDIAGVSDTNPKGHIPASIKAEDLQARLDAWKEPATWATPTTNPNDHRLFISAGFLFYPSLYPGASNYIQKNDGTARTPGGVLISWYQKYGLDFTDSNIDREDPDGDGFSNIVEFKNEVAHAADADGSQATNPLDPQSHPTYLSRLRLQKYDNVPFHIQFRGYQMLDGVYQFQIYLKDEPSYNQPRLKKTGDMLGFEGYKVGAFTLSIVSKEDSATHTVEQVDESTLELDRPDIGFKILLPFRKEIDSPESTADFVMLMPSETDKVIKVEIAKTFTPAFMQDTVFRLISVKKDGAVIRNIKTNQDINIPMLDPKEWDEVPVQIQAKAP